MKSLEKKLVQVFCRNDQETFLRETIGAKNNYLQKGLIYLRRVFKIKESHNVVWHDRLEFLPSYSNPSLTLTLKHKENAYEKHTEKICTCLLLLARDGSFSTLINKFLSKNRLINLEKEFHVQNQIIDGAVLASTNIQELWQHKEYRNFPVVVLDYITQDQTISGDACRCWIRLHRYAFFDTAWSVQISKSRLASELNKSVACIRRYLAELEKAGYIRTQHTKVHGVYQDTTIYLLVPDRLLAMLQEAPDREQRAGEVQSANQENIYVLSDEKLSRGTTKNDSRGSAIFSSRGTTKNDTTIENKIGRAHV